jgi:LppP/LprE lipoprotein
MRLIRLRSVALATALMAAGCGWSPPSAPPPKADTCTPDQGPTTEIVRTELAELPVVDGRQWKEAGRGHTTNCRLYWVAVSTDDTAPDRPQQVLFFDHGSPIGTPTPEPRPYVAVVSSGEDTVTVQYQWRQGSDQPCCPTGLGTVRFQPGDDLTLKSLDPIPNA